MKNELVVPQSKARVRRHPPGTRLPSRMHMRAPASGHGCMAPCKLAVMILTHGDDPRQSWPLLNCSLQPIHKL